MITPRIPHPFDSFHFRSLKYTQVHHLVAVEPPATGIGVVGGSGAAIWPPVSLVSPLSPYRSIPRRPPLSLPLHPQVLWCSLSLRLGVQAHPRSFGEVGILGAVILVCHPCTTPKRHSKVPQGVPGLPCGATRRSLQFPWTNR